MGANIFANLSIQGASLRFPRSLGRQAVRHNTTPIGILKILKTLW